MALDRWRTPTLAECNPGIEPTEFRVLVCMTEAQEMTKGGIMLPEQVKEREQFRAACGLLVAVSPHAFNYVDTWPDGSRPQVGDEVFTGHFPGDEVEGADGRTYRLCTDREIKAVLKRGKQLEATNGR